MKTLTIITLLCISLTGISQISFTLLNKSSKSIPLKIPGVMNPNLSPFSKSGVTLKEGQKIYYLKKKKEYLLLTVDNSYEGKELKVDALIKRFKRKKD